MNSGLQATVYQNLTEVTSCNYHANMKLNDALNLDKFSFSLIFQRLLQFLLSIYYIYYNFLMGSNFTFE